MTKEDPTPSSSPPTARSLNEESSRPGSRVRVEAVRQDQVNGDLDTVRCESSLSLLGLVPECEGRRKATTEDSLEEAGSRSSSRESRRGAGVEDDQRRAFLKESTRSGS